MGKRRGPYNSAREEVLPGVRLLVARTGGLGARLAAGRQAAGLTQLEAAAALGIARSTITMWERGYYDVPYAALVRLARLYRLTPDAIFGDDLAAPAAPDEGAG